MSHFSLLGVPFLALKCQVLRVSHFPFLTSHFPFLIPYFLFPHFRREVVSTVSASNQKWDMRSWNSEVRNGNSEARNGNSEVRNGNQENSFPISQKASEKWEVGLKWEFPFSKYPPQLCNVANIVKLSKVYNILKANAEKSSHRWRYVA